jgi:hypothetical protein
VGNQFETISLALAFAPDFPDDPVKLFSTAVVELQQEEGLLDHLELKYMLCASMLYFWAKLPEMSPPSSTWCLQSGGGVPRSLAKA